MTQSAVLTVSQLNYSVRHLLEMELGQIWLVGEISNFTQPVSGHWYLTLKDEKAQVRCAMFKMRNQRVNFQPKNGLQVLVRASVSLYEPRGDYQLILESMQPAGDGLLQQQFEQLKNKLLAEGLFADQHKKPIPSFVKRLGVITSASGAALQDILKILKRRDPSLEVVIYPSLVQGKEAAQDIVKMIELANLRQECDVLIVGRGGGSLEDLWCFNDEQVARAIFASQIPIISAVGHETDITIADFVADLRASTPSAAAELVSRNQMELYRQLQGLFNQANLAFDRLWQEKTVRFEHLITRLNAQHPARFWQQQGKTLEQLNERLIRSAKQKINELQQKLKQIELRLLNQHPQQQLHKQQQQLALLSQRLNSQMQQQLKAKQYAWHKLTERLERNPLPYQAVRLSARFANMQQRLEYAMSQKYLTEQQKFRQLCIKLDGLSPLAILARGYSVTDFNGHILTQASQVRVGDKIHTRLEKGEILSEVVQIC